MFLTFVEWMEGELMVKHSAWVDTFFRCPRRVLKNRLRLKLRFRVFARQSALYTTDSNKNNDRYDYDEVECFLTRMAIS